MSRWLPLRRRAAAPAARGAAGDTRTPEEAELLAAVKRHTGAGVDPAAALADVRAALGDRATRGPALPQTALVARRLRVEQHTQASKEVAAAGLQHATGPGLRASLQAQLVLADLDAGDVPARAELLAAARGVMAVADRHVGNGQPAGAAAWLRLCLDMLLHRTLHCDDLVSPLADDPAAFLAPLHDSLTYRRLHEAAPARPAPERPAGRPLRFLAVTATRFHFLEPVLERYEARDDVEVRRLDFSAAAPGDALPTLAALTVERLRRLAPPADAGDAPADPPAEQAPLGPAAALEALEWADTVFVEWCDGAAIWASLARPAGVRLVVRLHSVEALSAYPHLVDWGAVDDLVLVSPGLEALTTTVAPATAAVRRTVLPNAIHLADRPTAKVATADRTVGLVGWSSPVKDPLFALDVLDALRADDPAWRLVLLGAPFPASQRPRSARYQERFEQRLRERPDLAAAIDRPGHVSEIGRPEVGFVLSSSLREGFPVGVLEATASAAVPVVRDWPVVRRYGGARAILPDAWVVGDVAGAVARIQAYAEPGRRAAEAEVARRYVVEHYDWSRCAPDYDALLLT